MEFLRDEVAMLCRLRRPPRLSMICRGFHSASADIYDFESNPRSLHLSDLERLRTGLINGGFRVLLNDKQLFQRVFGQWLPVPPNVAIVNGGRLWALPAAGPAVSGVAWREITGRAPHGIVARPVGGDSGAGIVVIRPVGDGWQWNGATISEVEIEQRLPRLNRYLLSAFVEQAPTTAALYPRTTNTVRVLTMVDPSTGEAFIARAVQRIGVAASAPVDNWSQGGLSALVDTETGLLGKGATKPLSGRPQWHASHPELGTPIEGQSVPNWRQIRDALQMAAAGLPMLPYVGWDVIPTEGGFAVIEGNYKSDVNLLQVHGPLLSDERIAQFYRHHRVITPRA